MKRIGWLAVAGACWAGAAMAQDAPPPGCRWQDYQGEQTLACKDGKGHWRRSGDDMIVGSYPLPKPKPKPPAPPKPLAGPVASVPAAPADAVVQPALPQPSAPAPADDQALSAPSAATQASAAPAAEQKAAEPPAEPPKKPWWSFIWNAILEFLRMIGLMR